MKFRCLLIKTQDCSRGNMEVVLDLIGKKDVLIARCLTLNQAFLQTYTETSCENASDSSSFSNLKS